MLLISGQANFFEIPRNRVLRGSRQSDSNRRPADYKSAALKPTELCRHFMDTKAALASSSSGRDGTRIEIGSGVERRFYFVLAKITLSNECGCAHFQLNPKSASRSGAGLQRVIR